MVRRMSFVGLVAGVLALAGSLVTPAAAGSYTLHPRGFGEHSYAAWKGHEGLPDARGNGDHSLYFQKQTLTADYAAGVAVIKGFEGTPVSELGTLEFFWRTDGWCGAGAPRFNVTFENSGVRQTMFVGCQMMTPGETVTDDAGREWERRTYDGPFPDAGTITSIIIVFDEGNDIGTGFVHLDNIRAGDKTWTGPADNSNR